ncbi:MAG TPA: ATP-binding protein [Chitinophagales bacterium]|nr:ATP-binding protein [Chitinophagales bacterium]
MNFKDIVNRDLVNLQNCESEPIHIPGSIQPHGFLLAFNAGTQIIEYCSGNSAAFIGTGYISILGKPLADILGAAEAEKVIHYLTQKDNETQPPLIIKANKHSFNANVHTSAEMVILEMEPLADESLEVNDLYTQTRKFVAQMQGSATFKQLCQAVADETRSLTGFDRVMVYRFDKEYNGEVYAESKKEEFEPFLGLHYPHTDIPVQARQLYVKNLLRIIVDVQYHPVPIYTIDDGAKRSLDLSHAIYRSVSPIHIDYLKNMGVGATLTISLLYQGRLWGLITCHHYSRRNISPYTKLAGQLQGHFLTSQIDVRQIAERHDRNTEIEKALDATLARVAALEKSSVFELASQPELLMLTGASGVAIVVDGIIYSSGLVPSQEQLKELVNWFSHATPSGVYNTVKLSKDYVAATAIKDTATGVIYHSLGKSDENCIIWFKPELLKTVNWAGDPTKAIEKDEKGLSPRKSFALWQELRKLESSEWGDTEISAAARLAHALQRHLHTIAMREEEARYLALNEKLRKVNAELQNFNWISTHDLKEPLRKIQTFASLILDKQNDNLPDQVAHYVERMSTSASRMSLLINDILSYSLLRNKEGAIESVDLNVLLQSIKNDLREEIAEKKAELFVDELPIINGVEFQLRQLFLNLISNALKYVPQGRQPKITISYEIVERTNPFNASIPLQTYHQISVADNGIGFDNIYSTTIFEVFKRLHGPNAYKGTGIGLAICKEIMQNHGGFILAEGKEDIGATFSLFFVLKQPETTGPVL